MAVHPLVSSVPGEATHVGLVLGIEKKYDVRVMSDVWADITFAKVWDAEAGRPVLVALGNTEFGSSAEAEIDATPEVVAAHDAWLADEKARKAAEDEARFEAGAETRLRSVTTGCRAVVARGRKVPKGTEGRVFWIGQNAFGWRAGMKTDAGETVWTALSNLDRVIPAKPEGMSWQNFESHLAKIRAAA